MKNASISTMTNRELFTEYEKADNYPKNSKRYAVRYAIIEEMARRVKRKTIAPDVVSIFSQYKLNGAGDQHY